MLEAMNRPSPAFRSRLRNARGFTLVEVVVATFIMTFVLGSAIIMLNRGFASLDDARCLSYASQIMQSEMEKMRLTQWGNGTTAGTGSSGITAYATSPTAVDISSAFYHVASDIGSRMTMTRTATDVHTGMIRITLTITWRTLDGKTLSRSYITYYGKNGLYDFFSA